MNQLEITDEIFTKAVQDCWLNEVNLGDQLGVSALTVWRWQHGRHLPIQPLRPLILEWIQKQKYATSISKNTKPAPNFDAGS